MAEHSETTIFAALGLCMGVYATAVGFGYWMPPVKDFSRVEEWRKKHARKFRLIGPLLILCASAMAILRFMVD